MIIEKVRAMLHDSALPKFLWAEVTAHPVYLKNRSFFEPITYMIFHIRKTKLKCQNNIHLQ